MTDEKLKQAQDLKRTIAALESELEKFENTHQTGINVYIQNVGTLIEDVKQVFIKHLNEYNDKFKRL